MDDLSSSNDFQANLHMELPKEEFIRLIKLAHREIVYHLRDRHFFIFDGILFSTKECDDRDFTIVISGYSLSYVMPYGIDRKKKRQSKG